ncbi:hypothetical protein WDU94_006406 [Cyamophila willieti]
MREGKCVDYMLPEFKMDLYRGENMPQEDALATLPYDTLILHVAPPGNFVYLDFSVSMDTIKEKADPSKQSSQEQRHKRQIDEKEDLDSKNDDIMSTRDTLIAANKRINNYNDEDYNEENIEYVEKNVTFEEAVQFLEDFASNKTTNVTHKRIEHIRGVLVNNKHKLNLNNESRADLLELLVNLANTKRLTSYGESYFIVNLDSTRTLIENLRYKNVLERIRTHGLMKSNENKNDLTTAKTIVDLNDNDVGDKRSNHKGAKKLRKETGVHNETLYDFYKAAILIETFASNINFNISSKEVDANKMAFRFMGNNDSLSMDERETLLELMKKLQKDDTFKQLSGKKTIPDTSRYFIVNLETTKSLMENVKYRNVLEKIIKNRIKKLQEDENDSLENDLTAESTIIVDSSAMTINGIRSYSDRSKSFTLDTHEQIDDEECFNEHKGYVDCFDKAVEIIDNFANNENVNLSTIQTDVIIRELIANKQDLNLSEDERETLIELVQDLDKFNTISKYAPKNVNVNQTTDKHFAVNMNFFTVSMNSTKSLFEDEKYRNVMHKIRRQGLTYKRPLVQIKYVLYTGLKHDVRRDKSHDTEREDTISETINKEGTTSETQYPKLLLIYTGKFCKERFHLDPKKSINDTYYISNDGRLYYPPGQKSFTAKDYCVEYFIKSDSLRPLICFEKQPEIKLTYTIGMSISIICLLVTFLVYAIIPELRNLHGRCLMCHIISLIFAYLFLVSIQILAKVPEFHDLVKEELCVKFGFLIQFFFLAAFFWLNVMCFDIWWTFSRARPFRFLLRAYWYSDPIQHRYVRMYSALIDRTSQTKPNILSSRGSKRHATNDTERLTLYLKLFIVMGVTWIMEVLSWAYGSPENKNKFSFFWYLADMGNALQGVFIFAIFLCKRRILCLLILKLYPQCPWQYIKTSSSGSSALTGRSVVSLHSIQSSQHSIHVSQKDRIDQQIKRMDQKEFERMYRSRLNLAVKLHKVHPGEDSLNQKEKMRQQVNNMLSQQEKISQQTNIQKEKISQQSGERKDLVESGSESFELSQSSETILWSRPTTIEQVDSAF